MTAVRSGAILPHRCIHEPTPWFLMTVVHHGKLHPRCSRPKSGLTEWVDAGHSRWGSSSLRSSGRSGGPELRDMAGVAEDAGFDSLWVGDHLLFRDPDRPPRGPWEAWSVLAALAAITERVELGPLVASASFHSPAMLAKKAATIDEISGGRLILGLGAGWNEVEYRAFGFPFDHRVDRFEEALAIIRGL